MKDCFNPELLKIKSYSAPKRNKSMIRLDSMEHPFNLLAEIETKIKKSIQQLELNRYPNSQMLELEAQIKTSFKLNPKLAVLFGNGSDELIEMLLLATNKNRPVFSFAPSFSMYELISKLLNRDLIQVNLNSDFQIDIKPTLDQIKTQQPSLVFISEPNNPTGKSFDIKVIEKICEISTGLVVIDEAYFAFKENADTESYFIKILNSQKYPNMLVLRTLSKMGFAGIRFGFLVASSDLIQKIRPIRLPYNIGSLNQAVVKFALESLDEIWQQIARVRQSRDEMFQEISQINGVITYLSDTNFLLIQAKNLSGDELQKKLFKENIAVKNLNNSHPLLLNHLRVSMGTEVENKIFIKALKKIIKG